jgi:membrane-associated phospholipid phosphatase
VLVNQRRSLIASAVLLGGTVAVGALVALPATRDWVRSVDDSTRDLAVRVRNPPSTAVAEALSLIGSVWVMWPLRVLIALLLAARRRWLQLTAFALSVVTSEAAIGTVKALYDRPRPPGSLIETTAASFPSGHAIAATVTAFWLVIALVPPTPARWKWAAWAVVFAFVMAMSRVYLSAHWLTDVLAGALFGAGVAFGWPALLMGFTRDDVIAVDE